MAPAIADRRPKYVTKSRVIQRHAEVSARCLFLPIADIGCGAFMSTRPNSHRRRRPTARRARWLPQEHCLRSTGCSVRRRGPPGGGRRAWLTPVQWTGSFSIRHPAISATHASFAE